MTRTDAIKTIREAIEWARYSINEHAPRLFLASMVICDRALAALDLLTIEPSGDAKALLRRIGVECDAINYDDSREAVGYVDLIDAAKLIEADRERIRKECADRACAFIAREVEAYHYNYKLFREAIVGTTLASSQAKPERGPDRDASRVCGNCIHGLNTSLDDTRCYISTPYISTGRHCLACEEWEPCRVKPNPRNSELQRRMEAGK